MKAHTRIFDMKGRATRGWVLVDPPGLKMMMTCQHGLKPVLISPQVCRPNNCRMLNLDHFWKRRSKNQTPAANFFL